MDCNVKIIGQNPAYNNSKGTDYIAKCDGTGADISIYAYDCTSPTTSPTSTETTTATTDSTTTGTTE